MASMPLTILSTQRMCHSLVAKIKSDFEVLETAEPYVPRIADSRREPFSIHRLATATRNGSLLHRVESPFICSNSSGSLKKLCRVTG
jgi:hypothetical protein